MTTVKFFKTQVDTITGFEIKGHSGFATLGKDIVCASVSSAAYMTINTITDILNLDAEITAQDGYMYISLDENNAKEAQALLKGFQLHIKSLSQDYPKNIMLKFGGVRNA